MAERQIASQDETAGFIPFGDHLEEQVRLLPVHGQVSHLVDDEKLVGLRSPLDGVLKLVAAQRCRQLHQQIGGSDEAGAKPGLRCTISERNSKMISYRLSTLARGLRMTFYAGSGMG